MTEKIVNLSPHDVVVFDYHDKEIGRYPRAENGGTARVDVADKLSEFVQVDNGVAPIFLVEWGGVRRLPEERENVRYIVSRVVADHPELRDRNDLLVPYDMVRDEYGNVIGCRGFAR